MQFFLIYIAEAHAIDSPWPIMNGELEHVVEEPLTYDERRKVAGSCTIGLELGDFPTLVDQMDNRVNRLYDAHPDRLYLVGKDGRMVFCGAPGPAGFNVDSLEKAILTELGRTPAKN